MSLSTHTTNINDAIQVMPTYLVVSVFRTWLEVTVSLVKNGMLQVSILHPLCPYDDNDGNDNSDDDDDDV